MKKYKKIISATFHGVGALSSHLATATVQPAFENAVKHKNGSFRVGDEWSGTDTYEESDKKMLFGDRDLQAKIEAAGVAKMRTKLAKMGNGRQIYSSVVGVAPNVAAFVAGAPNSMIAMRTIKRREHVVNVAYNLSIGCAETSSDIIAAAANVAAAVLYLERGGVRCNLWAVETVTDENNAVCWAVKVKTSGQQMDTLKMAYPLAHASMLRRQFFRLLETTPDVPECFFNGYGYIVRDNAQAMDIIQQTNACRVDRVVGYYDAKNKTPEEIAAFILEQHKK